MYRRDLQGNIIALLDSNGNVVVQYKYDAWGNHKVIDAKGNALTSTTHIGNLNPFRYRSYYFDTETKLYFLKTRYYDPEVGRFINIDSVRYADPEKINGLNLYAYCDNNPVMGYDPEGTWNWGKFLAVAALAIVATVAVVATGGTALAVAATVVTGTVLALAAGAETTAVLDLSYTTTKNERYGISLVLDFKNMDAEVYGHFGKSYGNVSPGFGYSVGMVQNYDGKGSYGGFFANAGGNLGIGGEYAFDPFASPEKAVRSYTFTFSNSKLFSVYGGYDIFLPLF